MKQNSGDKLKLKAKGKEKKTELEGKKSKLKKHKNINSTAKLKFEAQHPPKQSFKEVINKFKKLFDDKMTFVKNQSKPYTERPELSKRKLQKSKKTSTKLINCTYTDKVRKQGFSEIISSMEAKLNQHSFKEKVGTNRDKRKVQRKKKLSKSKSKEKSRNKSLSKSVSTYKKPSKSQKPKIKIEAKRINTNQTQNDTTTKRIRFDYFPEEEKSSKNSVIVYNVDDDDVISFQRLPIKNDGEKDKGKIINTIEGYFHQFLFVDNLKQPSEEWPDQYQSNTIKIEDMVKEQQMKWLKLKKGLMKVKKNGNASHQLDELIQWAQNNYQDLKHTEIRESRMKKFQSQKYAFHSQHFQVTDEEEKKNSDEFTLEEINIMGFQVSEGEVRVEDKKIEEKIEEIQEKKEKQQKREETIQKREQKQQKTQNIIKNEGKQKEKKSKLSYDEAPLQIRKIFKEKRKSQEELQKQSQLKSKQINQKKLKEDIELMQFISGSSSVEKSIQEEIKKPKIQIGEDFFKKQTQRQEKKSIFKKEKSKSEENVLQAKYHLLEPEQPAISNSDALILPQEEILQKQELNVEELKSQQLKELKQLVSQSYREQQHPPLTPKQQTAHKISFAPYAVITSQEEQQNAKGQEFTLTKPKYQCQQECQQSLIDDLIDELIFEFNKRMYTEVVEFFNSKNIQIYDPQKQPQPIIECSQTFSLLTTHNMLEFMKRLPQEQFRTRLSHPLGLKSYDMLIVLRKIRYNEPTEDENQMEQSNYHSIIDLQHITDFQIQNTPINAQYNYTGYQQFFDQAIFDTINLILDELRPFGRHGYPPICFKEQFDVPCYGQIYRYVLKKMKEILSVRLGLMHYEIDSERIMRYSLDKFTVDCVKEFDEEWLWQKEGEFEIDLQLMTELQELIWMQEAYEILSLLKRNS